MIEHGRYSIQAMTNDVQMAGYWGELGTQPAAPAALPDPCSATLADLQAAMGTHVQGYSSLATLPTTLQVCVKNHKPGTDVLVIRKTDPDFSGLVTGTATDMSKLVEGQVYVQTGLNGLAVQSITAVGDVDPAVHTATFTLTKKDGVSRGTVRKYQVNIYYIAQCSVQVGTSCVGADGGNPIPTLKRVELVVDSGVPKISTAPVTVAEGIENLQVDYGLDTDGDGMPNGADADGSAFAVGDWANVVSLKLYLLARSNDKTGGFVDTKSYVLGTAGSITPATAELAYKRHVFVQSVRLVNPSSRRVL
jgi:type IV pilus assembly protein PilW